MRIRVSGIDTAINDATRAYAEYRFFTSIARHESRVRAVDIVVTRDSAPNRQFLCTVTVDLGPSGHVKTQARAAHPSGAIDRAADRTGWLIGHRLVSDFSLKASNFSS
jgi:ribosome-associated translation inhibitor RaiA